MSTSPIGKLERVALREVWKHEATDFTQWLPESAAPCPLRVKVFEDHRRLLNWQHPDCSHS